MSEPSQTWRRLTDLIGHAPAIPDPADKMACTGCHRAAYWDQLLVLVDNATGTCSPYCHACAHKRTRTRAA